MGKRLATKHKKKRRDTARAYAANPVQWEDKVAKRRSTKALKKKAYPMA